ncbi:MAG TPA: FecR family protein, partial [Planctomycetota bacterium]|nr:FecR family protein [Planctomycetota bacterium]
MSRLDDLLLAQLDGALDEAGREELGRLLRQPGAAESARRILDLEAALRAGRRLPDFSDGVLARLDARRADRVERGVMARIATASPGWSRPARVRRAALASAAAALFIGLLPATFRAPTAVARLVSGAPDAVVERDGRFLAATEGLALAAGDVIATGQSGIVVRYDGEATRLRLEPQTRLRLGGGGASKRLDLREGEVIADVAPQRGGPLLIAAPHGRAEVLGTRLKISAVPDATRVEVEEGRVRMTGSDGRSVEIPARHFALAADGAPLSSSPVSDGPAAPPRVESFSL